MTTTSVNPVVSTTNPLWRRFIFTWRTFFTPGDMTALLIAMGLLVMPTLALHAATWPLELNIVLPITIIGVLLGFLLARSQYNELFALILSGLYGLSVVMLIAALNQPGGVAQGVYSIFNRIVRWMVDALGSGINQDDLMFTLLIAILFWFLGYNAAWHIFRIDRVWRVIVPPGLILATNSIFHDGTTDLTVYTVVFFFLALLLIVRSTLDERQWEWYVHGIQTPRTLHQQFLRVGAVLALVSIVIAWGIPSGDLQDRLDKFQNFLREDPLTQIGEFWNRLFSPIETEGPVTADYFGADSLELGGAIRLGEQEVFLVSAPPIYRYYWRSRVFDTYDRGRWTPAADTRLTTPDELLVVNHSGDTVAGRQFVQQEFTMALSASRLVYAAPQPSQINLPTRADLRYLEDRSMSVSVIRPLEVLFRGAKYSATSIVTTATANELRSVPSNYPQWVRDIYLDVPLPITQRTANLAQEIVTQAGAFTAYDQAKAVESWLRMNIIYNESIPQPPPDQDQIDWVLFDLREGYCEYYASSMIVMLRSLGIPARMAAGFAQGTWDAEQQHYIVRERDAHTWVEVFFPGYGWIEFEPTAAQAPLNRVGDNQSVEQQPTPPPAASPTPTATFTPTPSPTLNALTTTPQQQNQDSAVPSPTPTFTPSPTATPVIVPTQPPPVYQPPRSLLSLLLPPLMLAILSLLLIVLLIGFGFYIWWRWEWRGMRDFSPITRAYARLERFASLIGIQLRPQQTPEERRRRMVRDLPQAERPISAITRMYTVERYGPDHPDARQIPQRNQIADQAWSETRSNILQRFLRRFVRRLFPWSRR